MKKNGVFSRIFMGLVFLFLYAPILVLIIFSFNESKSRANWTGFSLKWYIELFQDSSILNAFATTILVSVLAAAVATVLGTMTAIGLMNMRRRSRNIILSVNNIPMTNADIITGVSMMLLFVGALGAINATLGTNIKMGFVTLLLAHITFDTPYVILSVMPKLRQLDPNLMEAAEDLGASTFYAFRKVVLPEIMSGVVNGAIMAFTMSVDDFVISYFTAGSRVQTLAMVIYSMTRKRISPEINALSTLLFVIVLTLLVIINLRQSHQEKAQAKREAVLRGAPVESDLEEERY